MVDTEGLPNAAVLKRLETHKIQGEDGEFIRFGTLLKNYDNRIKRVLVVFIRHFFCGNCQEYVRRICSDIPSTMLPQDFQIVIVGCGAASLIKSYVELTKCPYPIYADHSAQIYDILAMHRTLSLGTKSPEYIQHSLVSGALKSIVQGVKRFGSGDMLSAGDLSVNGGEFLFTRKASDQAKDLTSLSSSWTVPWCHRMPNSRGHAEIEQLRLVIGSSDQHDSDMADKYGDRPNPPPRRSTTQNLKRSISQRRDNLINGLTRSNTSKPTRYTSPTREQHHITTKHFKEESHSSTIVHLVTT